MVAGAPRRHPVAGDPGRSHDARVSGPVKGPLMSMSFDPPSRPGPAAADPPGSEAPGPTAPGTQPPGTDTPGPDTPGTQPPGTDARSPAEQRPRGRWTVAGVVGTGGGLLP